MTIRKMNIAIVGLGNIGSYLFKYLQMNKKILSKKNNCVPNIIFVSAKNIKKKRNIKIHKKKWLNNYLDASTNKDVDLIIELIGGAEGPAKKLVFEALRNKKHVVTANKALISKYGDRLAKIAETNKAISHVANLLGATDKGYRVLTNIGNYGGQEVPHLHFHIFAGEKIGKMVS